MKRDDGFYMLRLTVLLGVALCCIGWVLFVLQVALWLVRR